MLQTLKFESTTNTLYGHSPTPRDPYVQVVLIDREHRNVPSHMVVDIDGNIGWSYQEQRPYKPTSPIFFLKNKLPKISRNLTCAIHNELGEMPRSPNVVRCSGVFNNRSALNHVTSCVPYENLEWAVMVYDCAGHCIIFKLEQTEMFLSYVKWSDKLGEYVSPSIKEWIDI